MSVNVQCPLCGSERSLPKLVELPDSLDERQKIAMNLAVARGFITNGIVRQFCPFWHTETIRKSLSALVDEGLLNKYGRKKGTYYVIGANVETRGGDDDLSKMWILGGGLGEA